MEPTLLKNRRVWLGLAVSALFLVLLLRQVDRDELADALGEVAPGWLVLAFAAELGALYLRALRWRRVLASQVDIGRGEAASLIVIGYAANNLLPMRAGELVRAQLLHDRAGTSRLATLGTIVVERVFDGVVLVLLLTGTIAFAGGGSLVRGLAVAMIAVFAAAAIFLALVALRPARAEHAQALLLRAAPAALRTRARVWLGAFASGLHALRGPGAWAAVAALSVASWLLEAAAYWLVGESFGLALDPPLYLAVCGAANLAIVAPSTAGGVGPFEFFAREVVAGFGVATALATAYALVLHALLLIPVALLGLALLWHRHVGLRALLRGGRAPQEEPVE